jgi:hypothetical protein
MINREATAHLVHFGVKGMHWGFRKTEKAPAVPDGETRVIQKKPGTKVTSEGGRGVPAHDDAIRSAHAKQVAKTSTTDALSTKELQDLVTRLNLERQYAQLTTPQNQNTMKNGLKKVNEIMAIKKQVDQITNDPFIKEQMSTIATDLQLDKVIRKGTQKLFKM